VFLPTDEAHDGDVAVHGRLFDDDGSELFAFVDLFTVEAGVITHLRTFTR
jgi:hypothetical protein